MDMSKKPHPTRRSRVLLVASLVLVSCVTAAHSQDATYSVQSSQILKNGVPTQWRGANAMHVFGGNSDAMATWGMDTVREFVGNMSEQPVGPETVQDKNGKWLHGLQKIVDRNRANGMVTIICPFGWNGTKDGVFLGKNPSQTDWYDQYKAKMRQWATHFKDQPDVWLEVWNESYKWNRSNGYSDDMWLRDMTDMVDNIRSVAPDNIIVVPGAEMGQDEKVLLNKGRDLLEGRRNIVFDIHAYEKWLRKNTEDQIETRLRAVQDKGMAVIVGEVAPFNASGLMDPAPLLRAASKRGVTVLAWVWTKGKDKDALLDAQGNPNDRNNNRWGSTFQKFAREKRTAGE